MKISYLLNGFGKTGGSIVLYNFMDQLVARGYEVYAVTPTAKYKWEVGMWNELIRKDSVATQSTKIKSAIKGIIKPLIADNYKIKKARFIYNLDKMTSGLVRNWEPSDVTVATYCLTAYAGLSLSSQTVSLYHMQHFEELFFEDVFERMVARNTYKLPLGKIANSTWLRNIVIKYFNEETYLLCPGIDLDLFKSNNNLSKYSHKKEWNIVSYFDERREWKGFNDAVIAIKRARKVLGEQGITINWKVFGLNAPTRNYDTDFDYVGRIFGEGLCKFYSDADIVLLTSWYESFPLPPIEAMASGSLIISTQYGVEDYVTDYKNGLVVLPRKADEISDKIVWAVNNPEMVKSMVLEGNKTAQEFSWKNRTDKLEIILNDAVKNYAFKKHILFDDLVAGRFEQYMYDEFKIKN
jgi:glycosyltransferase involved in cell wall biosynthesis